jgi:deoxyribonuclease V
MIACLDVHYEDHDARAACVLMHSWGDAVSAAEIVEAIAQVEPYEPGRFYRRELPCLLAVLGRVTEPLATLIIDGYAWLQDENTPGLGAHLYQAMGQRIPVIGVAKTRFAGADAAREIMRSNSKSPLFVTSVGFDLDAACRHIQGMHGPFRVPTLLKRVDQLCRGCARVVG